MEPKSPKLMTPFDCQTTPDWIYTLKLLLPYTPDNLQHTLAVFIRFQEMQYTFRHFRHFAPLDSQDNILGTLKPYMSSSEQEMMEQMEMMMNMMEMMDGVDLSSMFNMKGDFSNE